jgi:hypothetical protein
MFGLLWRWVGSIMTLSVLYSCACRRSFIRHYGDGEPTLDSHACPSCGELAPSVRSGAITPALAEPKRAPPVAVEEHVPRWQRRRRVANQEPFRE